MMSRRNRRNKPEPVQPQEAPQTVPQTVVEPAPAPTVDAALLKRLAALETAVSGLDMRPAAVHNRKVLAERARTTRPAGPAPEGASRCRFCGTAESSTGWRLIEEVRDGWTCTACADVALPPYVNGSRRIPNAAHLPSLLASAALGIEPVWWLVMFGQRYGLDWSFATEAGTGSWSHIADTDRWREVARLAERRLSVGMGALAPVDMAEVTALPEIQWQRQYDPATGRTPLMPVEVYPERSDKNTPERLAVEAELVEQLIKARHRKAKEAEAAAAEQSRQAEIRKHYRDHAARLEKEIQGHRAALRQDLRTALGKGDGR